MRSDDKTTSFERRVTRLAQAITLSMALFAALLVWLLLELAKIWQRGDLPIAQ